MFLLVAILLAVIFISIIRSDCDLTLGILEKYGKPLTSLSGKVVWIIGASSGIGENLAYELAASHCKIILSARREEELTRVKNECLRRARIAESDVVIYPLDIAQTDTHPNAVKEAIKKFGQIDILVNNAAYYLHGNWESIDLEVDRKHFDVNVFGVISLTRLVLRHFLEKNSGHIVNTSSLGGKMGFAHASPYSGSKHALHGYMETLRWEKTQMNVYITMLCPGPIQTDMLHTSNLSEKIMKQAMTANRCGHLCAVAIANKVDEAWIATQPYLLSAYGIQYFPTITRKLRSMFDMVM